MNVEKGEGGGHQMWIKNSLVWILLTLADVHKGGGGRKLIHKMWIIFRFFLESFPTLKRKPLFDSFGPGVLNI